MTLDAMSNSPFFTSKYREICKENPVVLNQKTLTRAFFHSPIHSESWGKLHILINIFIIFFRTMLARWYDLQRKEAGKGIKVKKGSTHALKIVITKEVNV